MNREAKGQGSEPGAQRPLQERLRRRAKAGKRARIKEQPPPASCVVHWVPEAFSVIMEGKKRRRRAVGNHAPGADQQV